MKQHIQQLFEERLKNKTSHKCNVSKEDYETIQPKIDTIMHLAEIEGSIYAIYDLNRNNYLLQSEEQKRVFGTASKDQTVSFEMHYDRIHPEDLAFVLETDNMLHRYYLGLPSIEKKNYKLVYDFRTRNTEGFYVRHMHQSVVLEQDKEGRSWLVLVISHLLSDRSAKEKPQRHLVNLKTGKFHLFNDSDTILTKREQEILSLIGRGYDSINISEKLHISINTVNNHRQNILRKTGTENATQAVLYCKRLGII